jgi:transcription elongation factor Elf1
MKNDIRLGACPFCGEELVYLHLTQNGQKRHYVKCGDCSARGPEASNERTAKFLWSLARRRGE